MAHILQNEAISLHIDLPTENYQSSRFDWSGKIVGLSYRGKSFCGAELAEPAGHLNCGRGFYNEFGLDAPVGYDDVEPGEWFHKIGVGLLQRDEAPYDFLKRYNIQAAEFTFTPEAGKVRFTCQAPLVHGYAYRLEKEIMLQKDGFTINYLIKNIGSKSIRTNEYNHNFLALDQRLIDENYVLTFPFQIDPAGFIETVNPEGLVQIGQQEIGFLGTPKEPFYFSNLSGGKLVDASWMLENRHSQIGITEVGNFRTDTVNLWGCGHVVSPELFIQLDIPAGQIKEWSRRYRVYEIR